MPKTNAMYITLGWGGQILEVPENGSLLEQLNNAPVLTPDDLVDLAIFYRGFPTNESLANHLELFALREVVNDPRLQESLSATGYLRRVDSEDKRDGGIDEGRERGPVSQTEGFQWVLFSDVGLLIETVVTEEAPGSVKKLYYVIGVSPAPDSLES